MSHIDRTRQYIDKAYTAGKSVTFDHTSSGRGWWDEVTLWHNDTKVYGPARKGSGGSTAGTEEFDLGAYGKVTLTRERNVGIDYHHYAKFETKSTTPDGDYMLHYEIASASNASWGREEDTIKCPITIYKKEITFDYTNRDYWITEPSGTPYSHYDYTLPRAGKNDTVQETSDSVGLVTRTVTAYTQTGWRYGSETVAPGDDVNLESDTTFEAVYSTTSTTTYYVRARYYDGSTLVSALSYDTSGPSDTFQITLPGTSSTGLPTKAGHTLHGWIVNGQEYALGTTITLSSGTHNISASWSANAYPVDVQFGSDVTVLERPAGWNQLSYNTYEKEFTYGTAWGGIAQEWDGRLTRPGYTLKSYTAWSHSFETVGESNNAILPTWTVNQYTITFDSDGGTAVSPITQDFGSTITPPATPSKTGYTFSGWFPAIPETMPAQDITCVAQWSRNSYTVAWVNYDGTTLKTDSVLYGDTPEYTGVTPTKPATAQYSYAFTGWSPEITPVSGGQIYTAQYSESVRSYLITWTNYNGAVLDTEEVEYGETPVYSGSTPTRPATAQYTYAFSGWGPEIEPVTGERTYTALFTTTVNEYWITFKNYNGQVLQRSKYKYGTTPVYSGSTPTRPATAQYTYAFSGWSPSIVLVTGDKEYTAQYSTSTNEYTVTFKNYNGEVLQTGSVAYGATPEYTGDTPEKPSTAQYAYSFTGWDPELVPVTETCTYIAQFSEAVRSYVITWADWDGTVLDTDTLQYGAMPSYSGDTPTREATAQYTYSFSGWSPTVGTVVASQRYTAQYSSTVNNYTVLWKNYDGTVLETDSVPYGATPSYDGNTPVKPATTEYAYEFRGWAPTIVPVQGAQIYTAQFGALAQTYKLTYVYNNGTAPSEYWVDFNDPISAPADPDRVGYVFDGWDEEIPARMPDHNLTITALWHPISYRVVFYKNNVNATGTTAPIETTYDTSFTLDNGYSLEYYSFQGWATSATGDVVYGDGESVKNLTAVADDVIELYAKWRLERIVLTVGADGEDIDIALEPVAVLGDVTWTIPAPHTRTSTAEGITFTPGVNDVVTIKAEVGQVKAETKVYVESITFAVQSGETGTNLSPQYWCSGRAGAHSFDLSQITPAPTAEKDNFVFLNWYTAVSPVYEATGTETLTRGVYPTVSVSTGNTVTMHPGWGQYRHEVTFGYGIAGSRQVVPSTKIILNTIKGSFTYTLSAAEIPDASWDFTSTQSRGYTVYGWTPQSIGAATYGRGADLPETVYTTAQTVTSTGAGSTVQNEVLTAVVRPKYLLTVMARTTLSAHSVTYSNGVLTPAITLTNWSQLGNTYTVTHREGWNFSTSNLPSASYSTEYTGYVTNTQEYMSYRVTLARGATKAGPTYAGATIVSGNTIELSGDSTAWYETVTTTTYKKRCRVNMNSNWDTVRQVDNESEVVQRESSDWRTATAIIAERFNIPLDATFDWQNWTLVGWSSDPGSLVNGVFTYTMENGAIVGFVPHGDVVQVDFGETTYYAVWQTEAILRYGITISGLEGGNESIDDPQFITDGTHKIRTASVTLYMGEKKTWDIIESVPTRAAGTLPGESTPVERWDFGGWIAGGSYSAIYAAHPVARTPNPTTTITVQAGQTVELRPNWCRAYTKTFTFVITQELHIISTYMDSDNHTHPVSGFIPTSLGADDTVYAVTGATRNADGSWTYTSKTATTVSAIDAVRASSQFRGWSSDGSTPIAVPVSTTQKTLTDLDRFATYYTRYAPRYKVVLDYSPQDVPDTSSEWISSTIEYVPKQYNTAGTVETTVPVTVTSAIPDHQTYIFSRWQDESGGTYLGGDTVSHTFNVLKDQIYTLILDPLWTTSWEIRFKMCRYTTPTGTQVGDLVNYALGKSGEFGTTMTIANASSLTIPNLEEDSAQNMWRVDSVYVYDADNPPGTDISEFSESGYDPISDTITFKPVKTLGASITLLIKYVYATYTVSVDQGENPIEVPGHTGDWVYTVTYTGAPHKLTLSEFAPGAETTLMGGGIYAFSGYARSQGGQTVYRAGKTYLAYLTDNGAYPTFRDTLYFVAQWGKFVNLLTLMSITYVESGFTAEVIASPTDVADGSIELLTTGASGSTITVGTTTRALAPADCNLELINEGVNTRVNATLYTPGIYHFVFVPTQINESAPTPTLEIDVVCTKLAFSAYSDAQDMPRAYLPDPLVWVKPHTGSAIGAETVSDLTAFTASVNLRGAQFGGWTEDEDGTEPITSCTVTEGTEGTIYALWRMDLRYALNGGNWRTSQDQTLYRTLKNGYESQELVMLTDSIPVHPTKRWSAWEVRDSEDNLVTVTEIDGHDYVQFKLDTYTARALWVVEDLEWVWGDYMTQFLEPEVVSFMDDESDARPMAVVQSTFNWRPQGDTWGVEFNNELNTPSHIKDISLPVSSIHIVEFHALDFSTGADTRLWSKSYFAAYSPETTVAVQVSELPKSVMLGNVITNRVLGRIWIPDGEGDYIELIPVNGVLTVPVGTDTVTSIYLRIDGLDEHLAHESNPKFITTLSDLEAGIGTETYPTYTVGNESYTQGSWLILSNKLDHQFRLDIPDKIFVAGTYKLVPDAYGTWYFREIHENWLTISTREYPVLDVQEDDGEYTYTRVQKYGTLRVSTRADGGYYAVSLSAHPTKIVDGEEVRIERMYVVLLRIIDEVPDAPLCKITKYPTALSGDAQTLYLSTSAQTNISVTSVLRSFKAQLNQSPMLTKSSQFNYIIDLGNTESLRISVTRTQPEVVNDDDIEMTHPETWSNRKWMEWVKTFFDQWQNANYNAKQERSGGYNLIFDPVVDYNGYPKLDKNVFLSAPLAYKFDRALVNLTLQFTVASMLGRHASAHRKIRCHYKGSGGADKFVDIVSYTQEFTIPAIPYDAYQYGQSIQIGWRMWKKSENNEAQPVITFPGDIIVYGIQLSNAGVIAPGDSVFESEDQVPGDEIVHIYAYYSTCKLAMIIDDPTKVTINLNDYGSDLGSGSIWMRVTAVGAGGGGGSSRGQATINLVADSLGDYNWRGNTFFTEYKIGGGGGSGYVKPRSSKLDGLNHVLEVSVGRGGGSETNGGSTEVIMDGAVFLKAAGGKSGTQDKPGDGGHKGGEHAVKTAGSMYGIESTADWAKGELKGSNGEPTEASTALNIAGGPGTISSPDANPSSGGGVAEINTVLAPLSGEGVTRKVYRWHQGVRSQMTSPIRIKSIGGSILSQNIESAVSGGQPTTVSAGYAKYGGGGCSELRREDASKVVHYKPVTTQVSGVVRGVKLLYNLVTTLDFGESVAKTIEGVDISVNSSGHAGADGVVIIEFYS